ncbi:MAG: molybdopterin oxidoreductase family protein, partial [Leptospiraceae bacterium]|nr:molybdopterin oxidoreductase family protein [Leptospiraceae bacterium]
MQETHYRSCNLCEAMCGLTIEVEDSRVTSIKGDKEDPFSRGHICPKGTELKNLYEDPDRIKRPLKRTESGWEEISWPQALSEVARGLHDVQTR